VKTLAAFFPFDLFGSGGAGGGANLLADAFREMLADNRRERTPTRASAYAGQVRMKQVPFERIEDYENWRARGRQVVRQAFRQDDFLLWVTGNHLGVLPLYDELSTEAEGTVVIQFDAHLDVYNLSDCTPELSHGNYLLHCAGPLPTVVNVGNRELLLRREHVRKYYRETFSAAALALDPERALAWVRALCAKAKRVYLDLDCDVFDPAFFPAVTHPQPFGLSPAMMLRFLDAAWAGPVRGLAVSEFDPGRDRHDQGLGTLVWLLEYLLLRQYER
jgi:arginase family enzyme